MGQHNKYGTRIIKMNHYAGDTGYMQYLGKNYYVSDTNNLKGAWILEIKDFSDEISWLEDREHKVDSIDYLDETELFYKILKGFRQATQTHVKNWDTGQVILLEA